MEAIRLPVQYRRETGDGPARRLRAQGLVPGVVYGKGQATPLALKLEDLKMALAHGHNPVLELEFDEDVASSSSRAAGRTRAPRYAVLKELQIHPLKRQLLHVDLHEVDLGAEIDAVVPVEAVGTPAGVADGGVLEWEKREVNVRALPAAIPAVFEVDVSKLKIGEHLTVGMLAAPKGVKILDDAEAILVALVPPRVERAAEVTEETMREPEVVGGGPAKQDSED